MDTLLTIELRRIENLTSVLSSAQRPYVLAWIGGRLFGRSRILATSAADFDLTAEPQPCSHELRVPESPAEVRVEIWDEARARPLRVARYSPSSRWRRDAPIRYALRAMQAAERTIVTEDEYIVRERESEHKHELIHGEVVAMAGGSPRHNAITASVIGALRTQLKERPCIVFSSDQRIHVEATGLYTYADISVTFDRPRFHPKHKDTLLNPRLVVEVLSSSTEAYDRGAKFAHYRGLPSFQEYLLISQHVPLAEHYRRLDTGQWILTAYEGEAAIVKLPSLDCELPLADVYDKLQLLAPE